MESSVDRPSSAAVATLVLPTYNAAHFIAGTIDELRRFVERHPDWQVLFVCDGCTDDTASILATACSGVAQFDVITFSENRGKGFAVRSGFQAATTPYLAFTDVDLAYDPEDACRMIGLLREGTDLVVANRADPRTRYWISPGDFPSLYRRHLMSRAYNTWVRSMLPIRVRDTQAGLKAMTRVAWQRLASTLTIDGFAFDMELLARAGGAGLRIVEIPVSFRYVDPTTVVMLRHGWHMLVAVLRLRRELRKGSKSWRLPGTSLGPSLRR